MAKIASAQPAPQTAQEYEAEFALLMQEANHLNELMAQDRIEIERLKAETKIIREETHTLLISRSVSQQPEWEQQCSRDIAARDQENLILRLENQRLRAERSLPPRSEGMNSSR